MNKLNEKEREALKQVINASTYWLPDEELEEAYKLLEPLTKDNQSSNNGGKEK
jgi:hypothetical protein